MKEIVVDGVAYTPKFDIEEKQPVLIRSYKSGVHFGLLDSKEFTQAGVIVELKESRRVHYWEGAASLSQMAMEGIKNEEASRVAMELPHIMISDIIEIIPLEKTIYQKLQNMEIWKS